MLERMRIVFLQAEDGIRSLVRSRGLGDVYKRQESPLPACEFDTELPLSSAAVGMAIVVADEPQAARVNANILINIQTTFFILILLHALLPA